MSADSRSLAPGLDDPVQNSQAIFRTVLAAMSYPGRIGTVPASVTPPQPVGAAAAAVCLALADYDTPVWLDGGAQAAADYFRFHCGCPLANEPGKAAFAVVTGAMPPLATFRIGSDEFPEDSATVLVEVASLSESGPLRLTGPGIEQARALGVDGLRDDFWDEWAENRVLFPRGVDLILTAGDRLCGLPRTVRVTTGGEGE